jgi:hypothetical protein
VCVDFPSIRNKTVERERVISGSFFLYARDKRRRYINIQIMIINSRVTTLTNVSFYSSSSRAEIRTVASPLRRTS